MEQGFPFDVCRICLITTGPGFTEQAQQDRH
uniref:Uncharacterized protein n=1 Tax=Anguilla anguilla TaxID=7936 RepID=A0A0E9QIW1_ANGAN